ncbi:hypothetical protein FAZ69_24195 [Trinickia terrae]|uniref:Acetyltransferase n=1 Tax=Trinickia terrae TaxID=2571161 RepID=A0A4U1HQ88_9BURK|nr:DHH family phosphoesterase [Trinickia terrae]TKC83585.1 hypothetical protein FAZ69_24195 [Trinickia terrae]
MLPRNERPAAPLAYDVFNGDADGICALHQLRLAYPADAQLITGVKRDVELLRRVPGEPGVDVTVLDVSLDTNFADLTRLVETGARVAYYDHHSASRAFAHPGLRLFWDDSADVCTSLIVDRELGGRYRPWAIVAAFGDNLGPCARRLAASAGYPECETAAFDELGRLLNYNAYGDAVADLHVAPDALYRELHTFADPLDFIAASPCYGLLADGYREDVECVAALAPYRAWDRGAIYVLPDTCWSRRISGTFANRLAAEDLGASFAVLTAAADGSCCVSVRSSDPHAHPANALCERFASGGGRRAAAGINVLPADALGAFIDAFAGHFVLSGGGIVPAPRPSTPPHDQETRR